MTLDLQLKKTTGIFYGELMKDSGISLPNGRYITVNTIANDLYNNGVFVNGRARDLRDGSELMKRVGTGKREIGEELTVATNYGEKDNILTGVQRIGFESGADAFTFNPWKEITGGESFYSLFNSNPKLEDNPLNHRPRNVVEKIRSLYELFYNSPQQLQDAFLHEINTNCHLGLEESPLDIPVQRLGIIYEILKHTPEEHRKDMAQVLKLLADHNICVGKGEIARGQIEHLVTYDVGSIPASWEEGHLDGRVIAEKRKELNRFLHQTRSY